MNIIFDAPQLTRLCENLRTLSGARVSLLRREGGSFCEAGERAPFCARLNACAEGRERCQGCGARAIEACAGNDPVFRRCHAGVLGAVLPIRSGEFPEPVAYLCAGEFLDDAHMDAQWRATRSGLDWFPGDPDSLRESFRQLPRLDRAEQAALAGTLETLADYIQLRGLILPAGEGDLRRLERFLDEHYMEKLSLASISAQLHIGRTRLCALAKELSGGGTLFGMIARRRIEAAKALLARSDRPVSAIAEAVGISDYNYFSKIFRNAVGISPSEFRKRSRHDLDNMV